MTAKPAEESVPPTLRVLAGITWRVLIVVAGLVLVGYVLGLIMPVVMAIIFAMLLTAWATPVMNLFHKVMPKVIAMVLALLLIVGIVVVILGAVIRSSISEGPKLAASISSGFEDIQEWLKTGPLQLSDDSINSLIQQAEDWGKNLLTGMLSGAVDALGSIGTLIIAASVFFFGVIFFMLNPSSIWGWLISWMPKSIQVPVDTSGHLAWDSISGYTRGIVIIAFSDAVLVYIGLLVLQVPLAPALAALVFLGAFIPVIGAPIATFFAALVALAERGLLVAVLVVALTVVVGSFDGDVLQPLVMGKAVNLHPLAIVFAIAAGGIAMGIIGALIAVPVAGAIYSVAKYVTGRDPEHPYPQPEEIPVPVSP